MGRKRKGKARKRKIVGLNIEGMEERKGRKGKRNRKERERK